MAKIKTLLALLIASQAVMAAEHFVFISEYSSGMGNVAPANGGQYIYGEGAPSYRKDSPAYLTAPVKRVTWQFFSPEEEAALLNLRDQKLAAKLRARELAERKAYLAAVNKIDWPKVVVNGNQVCVPELANSESTDWKDKLTCYTATEPTIAQLPADGNPEASASASFNAPVSNTPVNNSEPAEYKGFEEKAAQ